MVVVSFQTIYYFIAIISIVCGAAYKLGFSCIGSASHTPALRDFVATLRARLHIPRF